MKKYYLFTLVYWNHY